MTNIKQTEIAAAELSETELDQTQGAGWGMAPIGSKTGYLPDGDVGAAPKAGFVPQDTSDTNI